MRIKINDKIYRLKEIESGADSFMELVEEPKYKDGDFLHSDWDDENITIICREINGNDFYYHVSKSNTFGLGFDRYNYWPNDIDFRLATESEKKELIDALAEFGKRWNAEKKCVEDIPVYNHGDFLVSKGGYPFILDREGRNGESHYLFAISIYDPDVKSIQNSGGKLYCGYLKDASVADQETIKKIHDGLKSIGKQWIAEKKCIEDIPKRKFKVGDKVALKSGCKKSDGLKYLADFDRFIGKPLTIGGYTEIGSVYFYDCPYIFEEEWLEPWSDEPKKGDWAIFWDSRYLVPSMHLIRLYHGKTSSGKSHIDNFGTIWDNAVKWDGTKEQFEKVLRGEI